jgi:hypothetical protein
MVSWTKTYGSGLYYLFGDDTAQGRYALINVVKTNSGYVVVEISSSDFGDSPENKNLLYQITEDGVQFRRGTSLACYYKKIV